MKSNEADIYSFRTAGKILVGKDATRQIGREAKNYGSQKVLIITDENVYNAGLTQSAEESLSLQGIIVKVWGRAKQEPTITSMKDCFRDVKDYDADLIVGIGGGSSMDTAKVISTKYTNSKPIEEFIGTEQIDKPGIPTILVPTTAGTGSEVTPNAIVTDKKDGLKKGIVSNYLFSNVAVIDPLMTLTLPPNVTASSGVDALTHSVESFISVNSNAISNMFALKSIELITSNIEEAYKNGKNIQSRAAMLLGSMLGGMALTIAGTTAVHALAYPLGGKFGVPHGVANALLLPYVMDYNKLETADEFFKIAGIIGLPTKGDDKATTASAVVDFFHELNRKLNIPKSISEFGVQEDDLDELAEAAKGRERLLKNYPLDLSIKEIRDIYQKAL